MHRHWYALHVWGFCTTFLVMLRRLQRNFFFTVVPLLVGATGCVTGNLVDGAETRPNGAAGSSSSAGSGSGSGSDSSSGSGSNSMAGASSGDPSSPLLPARIRRLTNVEYENSAHAVVGSNEPIAADFAPDTRQFGYTLNDAQRVDSVLVKQISAAATKLAAEVRSKLDTLAPCANPSAGGEACAKTFIQSFATHAFRRPLADDEVSKLVELFHVGADGATYADGIELIATGVLQSAGFLYLTETGDGSTASQVTLNPYETASAISYLVTAGPPDADLITAAANGELATPEQRSAVFTRLVAGSDPAAARARVLRVVQEWLGIDRLADTAKDTTVYPDFAGVKAAMQNESGAFLQRLVDAKTGTVGELLGASWTATSDQKLIDLYKGTAAGNGEVTLPERRGMLNQGAFLSVYAHASETGPVLRGLVIQRRLACQLVKSPSELKLTVPPLMPDPSKTTRQRLDVHARDPECAKCHDAIDSLGFPFERYDSMGATQTVDKLNQNLTIDSHSTVSLGLDFDGDYADSNELATALSKSDVVRECFARNIFRASSGRSTADVSAAEQAFIDYWRTAPAPAPDATHPTPASAAEGSILESLRSVITSPNFTLRRAQ